MASGYPRYGRHNGIVDIARITPERPIEIATDRRFMILYCVRKTVAELFPGRTATL